MSAILLAAFLVSASTGASRAPGEEAACAVATEYAEDLIKRFEGREIGFWPGAVSRPYADALPRDRHWSLPDGAVAIAPSPDLMASLFDAPVLNAVTACSDLRVALESRSIPFDEITLRQATMERPDGRPAMVGFSVGLPVLSKDGRSAVMLTGGRHGFLLHLQRRANGQWIVVGRLGLWIS